MNPLTLNNRLDTVFLEVIPGRPQSGRTVHVYVACACHLTVKLLAHKSRVPAFLVSVRHLLMCRDVRVGRIRKWGIIPAARIPALLVLRDAWLVANETPPTCASELPPEQQPLNVGLFG